MGASEHEGNLLSCKLTRSELCQLSKEKKQGSMEARETLILAHLRLVHFIARKYAGKGVPYDDLYQEGCYGLIRAVDLYEYRPNSTLQAFATHYITKYIKAAMYQQNESSAIILSEEYYYTLCRYQKAYSNLTYQLGHSPSLQELALELNVETDYLRKLNCLLFRYRSLDEQIPTSNGSSTLYSDIISATPNTLRPTEDDALSILHGQGSVVCEGLTDREREVILRRIGMTDSGKRQTYPMISAEMGFSIDTARRAFSSGIGKLRLAMDIPVAAEKK